MNIEFINWMVGYADGFEIEDGLFLKTPFGITYNLRFLDTQPKEFIEGVISLLLQKAIEGWNRVYGESLSLQTDEGRILFYNRILMQVIESWGYQTNGTEDQAKEQALKYIYEQEIDK